ncbi:hypothetical protein EV580_0095 [Mycobacterium sp. BK086]|uniref:hypothetical protein n=1 Tax=Mycobacterium sp. BK086 TaxID=2512165 RepID=UPI00105E5890|nr:hypothetical protein [Mycobacterium sp. BK086]TDO16931.1 hypothetical protein EV580_0095 [Mycobacterium sp. BK086]
MNDKPLWDPDRMRFPEDLDVDNLDQVQAWLDHPNTNAIVEDFGRQFRQLPAEQQRPEITRSIRENEKRRAEVTEMIRRHGPDDPIRASLQEVLDAVNRSIDSGKLRLLELDDED